MDDPHDVAMSVEDAKEALLEDAAPAPRSGHPVRDWIVTHPAEAVGAAIAAGAALAVFPRLRRIAIPLIAIAARRLM